MQPQKNLRISVCLPFDRKLSPYFIIFPFYFVYQQAQVTSRETFMFVGVHLCAPLNQDLPSSKSDTCNDTTYMFVCFFASKPCADYLAGEYIDGVFFSVVSSLTLTMVSLQTEFLSMMMNAYDALSTVCVHKAYR